MSRIRICVIMGLLALGSLIPNGTAMAEESLEVESPPREDSPASPLPAFTYQGVVLDYTQLTYKPHNDVLFPSVIKAAEYFKEPIARYYMYYAPHDAPGGICLATADALEGPWTEYPSNPVISHDWEPHYKVSHVCSPDAIWNQEAGKLFVYYHGENTTTRYATSDDGIQFAYGGVAVDTAMFEDATEASYAHVFRHEIAARGSRYVMLLMLNQSDNVRKVGVAFSADGREWTSERAPLITPHEEAGVNQIGSPWLFPWQGKLYILYVGNLSGYGPWWEPISDIFVDEVDPAISETKYAGRVFSRLSVSEDNARASDPCLIVEDGKLYLFMSIGARLNQKIALAIAESNSEVRASE